MIGKGNGQQLAIKELVTIRPDGNTLLLDKEMLRSMEDKQAVKHALLVQEAKRESRARERHKRKLKRAGW